MKHALLRLRQDPMRKRRDITDLADERLAVYGRGSFHSRARNAESVLSPQKFTMVVDRISGFAMAL